MIRRKIKKFIRRKPIKSLEPFINKIVHGDCVEIMNRFPNDSIDLIVTSPPYDSLRNYKGYIFDIDKILPQLFRVIKDGGICVWVVGDMTVDGGESGTSFKQALKFIETGFKLYDTMIYQKNGPAYPTKNKYYQIFEYMFVFSKGKAKTFNPIKDRENRWYGQKWSNKRSRRNKEGELKETTWTGVEGDKFGVRFNIWKYNVGHGYSTKDKIAFKHPAIFPELLAQDRILSWSNEKEIILDPFVGSGTTAKMAKINNRQFIGIDVCEEYVNIANERIIGNQTVTINL